MTTHTPRGYRGGVSPRVRRLIAVAIGLFAIVQLVGGVFSSAGWMSEANFAVDLRARRAENICAHRGVNSFRIWNRETTLPGFVPWGRPDKPHVQGGENDLKVHAYPPWHTAMFYFYGWVSERACLSLMALIGGLCLAFVLCECVRISKARFDDYKMVAALAMAMILYFVVNWFAMLNYGVLILAAFLLMNRLLEENGIGRDIAAGLVWAVMMIKPQVGLLFFWPLFWHRRYLAIVTAVATCLAATFATSLLVHESMIDLILQIPQIGKPYGAGVFMDKFVVPVVGSGAMFVVMALCFVLTGLAAWILRRNDFLVSCLPAAFFVPLWTYSQIHDHVILLPIFIFMAGMMFSTRTFNKWGVLCCAYCALRLFFCFWSALTVGFGLLDPTGIGWIYRLVEYAANALLFVFLVFLIREVRNET